VATSPTLFDDFRLGAAGFTDALGLTDHAAARVYVAQTTPAATGAAADAAVAELSKAEDAGALSEAGAKTADELKDGAAGVLDGISAAEGKLLGPLMGPLALVAVAAVAVVAIYFGPELKLLFKGVARA
jgi:hypothetical protein